MRGGPGPLHICEGCGEPHSAIKLCRKRRAPARTTFRLVGLMTGVSAGALARGMVERDVPALPIEPPAYPFSAPVLGAS